MNAMALQPDGNIVIGGAFDEYRGQPRRGIARVNADGTLDTTFIVGTGLGEGSGFCIDAIALQPDGKIVIGGNLQEYRGVACGGIARLSPDGSLDESDDSEVGADGAVHDLVVQPDGKVPIAGSFDEYDGQPRSNVARLNATGTRDGAFSAGNQLQPEWGMVRSIVPLPGDKVLAAGSLDYGYGDDLGPRSGVARLDANGNPDTTFDPGWGLNNKAHAVLRDRSGRLVLGGEFTWIGESERHGVGRMTPGGSVDAHFDPGLGTGADLVRDGLAV